MVHFSCKETYSSNVLETANQLRENQQLCDIVLIVGNEKVHAHRNVLVAGSDYFKTLFLGPFDESSKAEVDLSSTISDFPTFETIIKFLYTGEIDIERDNLEDLMKMSSCFLILQLQDFCTKFVKKNLILSTALEFYWYSMAYGFVELEKEIGAIVKSRFHDYFIFQYETLKVSPYQLGHLFLNGFLDFCAWDTILKFLVDWVSNDVTKQHLVVIKHMLKEVETEFIYTGNKLDLCEAKKQYFIIKDALEKLSTKLKPNKTSKGKKTVRKCYQLLEALDSQKTTDFLTHGFRKVRSRLRLGDIHRMHAVESVEDVLITITHRQSVIDAVNELRESDFDFDKDKPWGAFTGPVFDVCSYNPRSGEWYYLYSLKDEGIANTILRSNSRYPWEYACIGDRIFCAAHEDTYKSPAYKLKLEDFSVVSVSEGRKEDYMPNGFKPDYTRLVASAEHVRSVCVGTGREKGTFLRCRKFTSGDIFSSNDPDNRNGRFLSLQKKEGLTHRHCVSLNMEKNEMFVVAGLSKVEGCYVIDLSTYNKSTGTITYLYWLMRSEEKSERRIKCWIRIIQGKNRFYVVEITNEAEARLFKVCCRHEYKYQSKRLTNRESPSLFVRDNNLKSPGVLDSPDRPLFYEHVFQHSGSVWIFTGNERDNSSLFEVYEESEGKLAVREHTPPPFPYIIGAFSAQLSHNFLLNKERVVNYLLPK